MDYLWSRYNFHFTIQDRYFIYNSYTNNLFEISSKNYCDLLKYKEDAKSVNLMNDFVKELKDANILVEDDEHIYQMIKFVRLKKRFNTSMLNLTLVPTTACNFNCKYCFEDKIAVPVFMNSDTEDKIVNYIKTFSDVKYLSICWYGGEPLLAFSTIESLTKKIILGMNLRMSNLMITNGYLLNKEKILKLKSLCIKTIQITVDGLGASHNIKRPHKINIDSFNRIVANIKLLNDLYPELKLLVRVNIDKKNKDDFFETRKYISGITKNMRAFIYPGYIKAFDSSCCNNECMNQYDKVNFIMSNIEKIDPSQRLYPESSLLSCSARNVNSVIIGPNGEFYKCWSDIGLLEKSYGNVDDGILNSNNYIDYMMNNDYLNDPKCKECLYFPICDGGCPRDRLVNNNLDNSCCAIQKSKLDLILFDMVKNIML